MDRQSQESFQDRLYRIEADRVRAALDTPARGSRRARPWHRLEQGLKLASLSAFAVIGLKCALVLQFGPDAYAQHRAELAQGNSLDRIAAVLMAPDPVTGLAASLIRGAMIDGAEGEGLASIAAQPGLSGLRDTSGQSAMPVSRLRVGHGIRFIAAPRQGGAAAAVGIVGPKAPPQGGTSVFLVPPQTAD